MLTSNMDNTIQIQSNNSDSILENIPSNIPGNIPGNIAAWIFIYAEFTEFAFFFIIFLIAKIYKPELFFEGPTQLNTLAGMLNTLVLITSSFFVANAIKAIRNDNRKLSLKLLYLTLLLGATYCGIKTWEYNWNESMGINTRTSLFYSAYYYLTFNHILHVLMGMCVISWVTIRLHLGDYDSDNYEGLESAASYWHMIDIVWIIIFPLLYILR